MLPSRRHRRLRPPTTVGDLLRVVLLLGLAACHSTAPPPPPPATPGGEAAETQAPSPANPAPAAGGEVDTPPDALLDRDTPGRDATLPLGATGLAFDLPDQYDGRMTYPLPPAELNPDGTAPVVIVAYAGRRGADGRQAWTEVIRERYGEHLNRQDTPGLVVLAVAHMPPLPGLLRSLVVERFLADRPPTGLDWNRTVAEQLGYTPGVPNLAVLAPDGRFLGVVAGEATAENREELFQVLERAGLPSH